MRAVTPDSSFFSESEEELDKRLLLDRGTGSCGVDSTENDEVRIESILSCSAMSSLAPCVLVDKDEESVLEGRFEEVEVNGLAEMEG